MFLLNIRGYLYTLRMSCKVVYSGWDFVICLFFYPWRVRQSCYPGYFSFLLLFNIIFWIVVVLVIVKISWLQRFSKHNPLHNKNLMIQYIIYVMISLNMFIVVCNSLYVSNITFMHAWLLVRCSPFYCYVFF